MSSAAWVPLLTEVVQTELAERDRAERLAELVNQIRSDNIPILSVVKALGAYLTTGDDGQRARATGALAEVVEAVPAAAAGAGEVQHLVDFFTSRLTDWPAVRGALKGCLALLSRRGAASGQAAAGPAAQQQQEQLAEVEDAAAVALVRTAVSHVFIRALSQPDRALALRLLLTAMGGYGGAVLQAGLDLLDYLISSVDGEKDPRCLLLCFEAVRALLRLYHAQPETSLCHDRLEEGAEELFEVLACYFPITFTPPPNDPNRITRQDLAAGLEAALAAEPLFAPHVVPLACEKLSSTLRQAKLDALSLLAACAEGYGPAPLAEHVATLWAALRSELATPAAEGLLAADRPAAEELAAAAAACLARCLAAFQAGDGGARLAEAALQDESVRDMLPCIQSPGADPAVHLRSVLRAQAAARAAGALCRAGGQAAARALSQLVPPLLAAAGQAQAARGWQSLCLAWSALHGLLAAATASQALPGAAALPLDGALLQEAVAAAAAGLASAVEASDVDGGGGEGDAEEPGAADCVAWPLLRQDCTQRRAAALQLATLAAVLGDAAMAGTVHRPAVEAALQSVIQLLLAPLDGPDPLGTLAIAALAVLAGGSHAAALDNVALPRLVAAAQQPRTAAAALAALRALAAASGALQLEIVVLLDQPIQQLLPAAAAASAAGDGGGSGQHVLQQLLAAAGDVVSARQPGGEPAAAEATSFLQLGQHLFDAAQLLPAGGTTSGSQLQAACAELAYRAALPAPAEQQLPLAAAAAGQLAREVLPNSLLAFVACALLAALRPQAVRGLAGEAPLPQLVQRLVGLAAEQAPDAVAARWAAAAAAALLNKWPSGDDDNLAACVEMLQRQLMQACGLTLNGSGSAPAANPAAWACQAAVTRALAMRGSRSADAAVCHVIAALDAAAQGWQAEAGAPGTAAGCAAGVSAAASFLGALLEGGSSGSSPGLTPEAHAVAKPLWQQRMYTAAARQLLPLVQASEQAASPVLLLALGHLLRAAPDRVWQQEQQRMLPWVLRCLAALQRGPLAGPDLLLPLLLLLSSALTSAAGRKQAEEELLPSLVPVLLDLAAYRPCAAVRETSLQCLLLLVELPYTCLHPYRRQVGRVLAAAVDDGRRAVRLAAARCRQAWSAF